ncbi:MAG: XkdF-like putative serine protease domain-containing protein [Helicobacteraceae bacterium]|nr:XkdF-like putative serine protease domain-containing protein [Helicobacteraceae bacterium]
MKRLKNIEITHISLVKAGANNKEAIYKSKEGEPSESRLSRVFKSDGERGALYGIVYSPDEVDSQGEFAEAAEIEKAAYGFMKSLNAKNVDREHSFQSEDAFVAESWLVRKNDAIFGGEPIGSWAVVIKLESDALKEAVKKGEIKGLSMAGTADREEVAKDSGDGALKSLIKGLLDAIKSSKGSEMNKEKVKEGEAIGRSPSEGIAKGEAIGEKTAAEVIKAALEPIVKDLSEIKKSYETLKGEVGALVKEVGKSKQEDGANVNKYKEIL